jgi:hypothetical protein
MNRTELPLAGVVLAKVTTFAFTVIETARDRETAFEFVAVNVYVPELAGVGVPTRKGDCTLLRADRERPGGRESAVNVAMRLPEGK